jgi:hypothetical protein
VHRGSDRYGGLAYNGVGATWILTSDFAENGANSKKACDSDASSSRFTVVGRLLQCLARIGKGRNGVAGVSRSSSRAQRSSGQHEAAWQWQCAWLELAAGGGVLEWSSDGSIYRGEGMGGREATTRS